MSARYWIFDARPSAENASRRITAQRMPSWRAKGDTITQRAMDVIEHADGRAALDGDDRYIPHMTAGERASEAGRAEMVAGGWFEREGQT